MRGRFCRRSTGMTGVSPTREGSVALQAAAQPRRGGLSRTKAKWFYIFISPWIVGFILFTAGPIVASAYLSLTHNDPVNWPPKWVGAANYVFMVHDPLFWKSLEVTLYYTALEVPLSVVFAVVIALLLNQSIPALSVWRTVYYLPAVTAGVAVSLMWWWIFEPTYGLLNGTLWSMFHIVGPKYLIDPNLVIPTFRSEEHTSEL